MHVFSKAAFLCVAVFGLSACALNEVDVAVNYSPPAVAVPVTEQGKAFKLEVTDDRTRYRGLIGRKINGFGNELGAIRPVIPVREIVEAALIGELRARKISIDNKLVRALQISITALHNKYTAGFFAHKAYGTVAFTVNVIGADGANRYVTTVSEFHEDRQVQLASGGKAARIVEIALAKAMRALFDNPEFIAALAQA